MTEPSLSTKSNREFAAAVSKQDCPACTVKTDLTVRDARIGHILPKSGNV